MTPTALGTLLLQFRGAMRYARLLCAGLRCHQAMGGPRALLPPPRHVRQEEGQHPQLLLAQRHPVGHVGGSALRHVRHQKDDWQAVPSAGAVLPPAAAQAWWRRRRAAGDGQHSAGVRGSIHGWRGHWHRHGRNRGCGALLALPHRARGRQRRQPRAAVAPWSRWFVQRHVRAAGCVATVAQRAGTPPFPCTSMRQSCVFDVVA